MSRLVYFIATTNRTGGAWLCDMLRRTEIAGDVREIFDKENPIKEWKERAGENPMGVKCSWNLFQRLWPGLSEEEREYAQFIWLTRSNELQQAISQERAEQTGVWHVRAGKPFPETFRQWQPSGRRILQIKANIQRSNRMWRQWFLTFNKSPMRLSYERLDSDPLIATNSVLAHLGLPNVDGLEVGGLKRCRDELTAVCEGALTGMIDGECG